MFFGNYVGDFTITFLFCTDARGNSHFVKYEDTRQKHLLSTLWVKLWFLVK
jgi:hypothetical protein